ncbi:putative bifunctional diguanylate cyclase/phosphodiesterase [Bosea eneae]|uniref:Bifunctional diguanylate cyclase/phosphodiesterase n=1 Tax=Bosea eneae TaxID=151454 RepID=A0ABW0J0V8_9HYPH
MDLRLARFTAGDPRKAPAIRGSLRIRCVGDDEHLTLKAASHRRHAERLKQRDIEAALPDAIGNNEFELHYQPIVSLKTGRYWGFEGLVRWRRPGHGLVAPSDFIPTLESAGLIILLGQKLLRDACRAAATWPASIHVSVNVSPIQLASDCIIDHVREALEVSKLAPRRLTIEVTESVLLGDGAVERLRAIRAMGVCIALDDFGTGFASMSYLESYPYDKIKIDKSFVANLANPKSRAIVEATVFLAKALKIETTAEGVETQEQMDALRRAGASQAQGYLFAKPMPESEVAAFLRQPRTSAA